MFRTILHLDADAFASVERHGRPVARQTGGGRRRKRHHRLGFLRRADLLHLHADAHRPGPRFVRLVLLPWRFRQIRTFSRLMFSYAYDFTPDVEIGSSTKAISPDRTRKPALNIAETIRRAIRTSLSVSEGVGSNKLISQSRPAGKGCLSMGAGGQERCFLVARPRPGRRPHLANQFNAAGLAHRPDRPPRRPPGRSPAPWRAIVHASPGLDERPVVPWRARQILRRTGNFRRRHHR